MTSKIFCDYCNKEYDTKKNDFFKVHIKVKRLIRGFESSPREYSKDICKECFAKFGSILEAPILA